MRFLLIFLLVFISTFGLRLILRRLCLLCCYFLQKIKMALYFPYKVSMRLVSFFFRTGRRFAFLLLQLGHAMLPYRHRILVLVFACLRLCHAALQFSHHILLLILAFVSSFFVQLAGFNKAVLFPFLKNPLGPVFHCGFLLREISLQIKQGENRFLNILYLLSFAIVLLFSFVLVFQRQFGLGFVLLSSMVLSLYAKQKPEDASYVRFFIFPAILVVFLLWPISRDAIFVPRLPLFAFFSSSAFCLLFLSVMTIRSRWLLRLGYAGSDLLCVFSLWFALVIGSSVVLLHIVLILCGLVLCMLLKKIHSLSAATMLRVALNSAFFIEYILRPDLSHAFIALFCFYFFLWNLKQNRATGLYALIFVFWLYCLFFSFNSEEGLMFLYYFVASWVLAVSGILRFSVLRRRSFHQNCTLFFFIVHLFNFFYFTRGPDPFERRRVLSQGAIQPVFLYPYLKPQFFGQYVRYAFESCDGKALFLASRYSFGQTKFLKIKLGNLRIFDVLENHVAGSESAMDCKTGRLYLPVLLPPGGVVLKEGSISSPIKIIPSLRSGTVNQFFPYKENIFMVSQEYPVQLFHQSGKFLRFLPVLSSQVVLEPRKSLLFFTQAGSLRKYHLSSQKSTRLGLSGTFGPAGNIAYDSQHHKILQASFYDGNLIFFDVKGRKVEAKMYLEPFIAYLAYDPDRKVAYVEGHYRGNLYAVDVRKRKILKKLSIGRRCHSMYLSRDKTRLYVATTQGVLAVEVDKMLR